MDAELIALAATAGTAVAHAAGTDAWKGIRGRVARLFARGRHPEVAEQAALERLDRTAAEVACAESGAAEQAMSQAAAAWRARFQDLLEELGEADRNQAVAQLRALVDLAQQAQAGASARDHGVAINGEVRIEARGGSAAAVQMGNVNIANPSPPGPDQG